MKKRGSNPVVWLFLFTLLALAFYILYLSLSSETFIFPEKKFTANLSEVKTDISYLSDLQFYPNMRFSDKEITYHIDTFCDEEKSTRIRQAFDLLEQKTGLLKFKSDIGVVDISITCNDSEIQWKGNYFIAGEGGPTSILNTSKFYVIEKGEILLFYQEPECDNYNVELHELLHVLGFKHSKNQKSIMYEHIQCNQYLTQDIIDELIRLYSIESMPDLSFGAVNASKRGIYLDIRFIVRNYGLKEAKNTSVVLYEDEEIYRFELGDLGVGEAKGIDAKNIRVPFRADNLKLAIEFDGADLEEIDNKIRLTLND